MPPLEFKPGSYYATESDSDFDSLMQRAHEGELDCIEAVDQTRLKTYLFSPSKEIDDSDLIPAAMIQGVLRGAAFGNRIISAGIETRS